VVLKFREVIEYNSREIKFDNVFNQNNNVLNQSYDEVWNIRLSLIFSSLQNLKSIYLRGFRLTDKLSMTLLNCQKCLEMLICENCCCSFETGFVDNFVRCCSKLQFLFIEGYFEPTNNTSLSLIDDRLIVALVLKGEFLDRSQVFVMQKKTYKKKGVWNSELVEATHQYLYNNSKGDCRYDDDEDDEDYNEDIVTHVPIIDLPLNEQEHVKHVTDSEEEVNLTNNADGRVLKRTRDM
jgi:hypothetical protein